MIYIHDITAQHRSAPHTSDPPEERLPQAGGKRSGLEVYTVHPRRHGLRVLYNDGQLTVALAHETAVVDVGGADDDAEVIHDHQLTVHIHKLRRLWGQRFTHK